MHHIQGLGVRPLELHILVLDDERAQEHHIQELDGERLAQELRILGLGDEPLVLALHILGWDDELALVLHILQ